MDARPPLADATAAVLVLRRPDAPGPEAWAGLRRQVAELVVVDNRDRPDPAVGAQAATLGILWLPNANRGALAGAYNRAIETLLQERPALRHVLFLDEDTEVSGVSAFLADPHTAAQASDPATAAVSAAYRERATGLRARYLQLSHWRVRALPREFGGLRPVAFLINSMSLWSLTALQRIGPYDESLAVDHVDTDACLRARHAGYSLYVHGDHTFLHSIGQRRRFRLFGREMQAGGHGAPRRWLIARNTVWLARRELFRLPSFAWLCLVRLTYEAVGIVLVEDDRPARLGALVRGAAAGLFTRWRTG